MMTQVLTCFIVLISSFFFLGVGVGQAVDHIKLPNVAGLFYPDNSKKLSQLLDQLFLDGAFSNQSVQKSPRAIIVPHAGYTYSGAIAATAFSQVRAPIETAVVIAPSHYQGFDGVAIWAKGGFMTPLGEISIDESLASKVIQSHPKFTHYKKPFDQEHALEVQLPFIQRQFPQARIVPMIVGQPSYESLKNLAMALSATIPDDEKVLWVISTDLSHYHSDKVARSLDNIAIKAMTGRRIDKIDQGCRQNTMEMCGCWPVVLSLWVSQFYNWTTPKFLRYGNSADTSGDKERVVGYAALAMYEQVPTIMSNTALSFEQKRFLVELAKKTIRLFVLYNKKPKVEVDDPRLKEYEGVFVSIYKHGQLRGCIGHIIGEGPMCQLVQDMAVASATQDPRFPPLKPEELNDIEVEISVLSKPQLIANVEDIVLGEHGVIVSRGHSRGVFLPQVAIETGWSREQFLSALCSQKAGLSKSCWQEPDVKVEVFTADVFSEKDLESFHADF